MLKKIAATLLLFIMLSPFVVSAESGEKVLEAENSQTLYDDICQYVFEKLDAFESEFSVEIKGETLSKYSYEYLLNNETEYEGELIDFYIRCGRNDYNAMSIRKYTISKSVSGSIQNDVADSMTVSYTLVYDQTAAEKEEAIRYAEDTAKSITSGMTSDYDKALAMHNYIIDTYKYDTETDDNKTIFTAPKMIENGKGVCGAYASLYHLMLDAVGVKNKIVFIDAFAGSEGQMTAHAWNMVNIDGLWYHVDVTWDDPVNPEGLPQSIDKYLFVSDDEIAKDHVFNALFYPKAPIKYGDVDNTSSSEIVPDMSPVFSNTVAEERVYMELPTAMLKFILHTFFYRVENVSLYGLTILTVIAIFVAFSTAVIYIIKRRHQRKKDKKQCK